MDFTIYRFGILFLATAIVFVKCDGGDIGRLLERHSIYYGIALIATKNGSDLECIKQLTDIEEGIRNTERWAVKRK